MRFMVALVIIELLIIVIFACFFVRYNNQLTQKNRRITRLKRELNAVRQQDMGTQQSVRQQEANAELQYFIHQQYQQLPIRKTNAPMTAVDQLSTIVQYIRFLTQQCTQLRQEKQMAQRGNTSHETQTSQERVALQKLVQRYQEQEAELQQMRQRDAQQQEEIQRLQQTAPESSRHTTEQTEWKTAYQESQRQLQKMQAMYQEALQELEHQK